MSIFKKFKNGLQGARPLYPFSDGSVSYFMTDDRAAVDKYYRDVEKYDEKMGNSLHPTTLFCL
jgi:hypothetical protein